MSGLAKTFVILILLLSVFFFGTTATLYKTRSSWRAEHESYKENAMQKIEALEGDLKQTRTAFDEKLNELGLVKGRSDQLGISLKKSQSDLSSLQRKIAGLEGDLRKATATSDQLAQTVSATAEREKGLQSSLDSRTAKLDEVLSDLDLANQERDSMKLSLVRAQQQLHESRSALTTLSEQFDAVKIDADNMRKMLGSAAPTTGSMPQVEALVSAVDAGESLAVISAGREQLVQIGHQLTVSRGDSFIAKLEVIKVYPDLAGARIVWTADGKDVRRGDRVYTSTN